MRFTLHIFLYAIDSRLGYFCTCDKLKYFCGKNINKSECTVKALCCCMADKRNSALIRSDKRRVHTHTHMYMHIYVLFWMASRQGIDIK